MEQLFASGLVVELILGFTAIEAILLVWLHRWRGAGPAPGAVIPNLLSGACLLAALRIAIGHGWWGWMSAALLGALLAHLTDLYRRWNAGMR